MNREIRREKTERKRGTEKMPKKQQGGFRMPGTIIAVNAGPRKGWNTDILLNEAADGAKEAGAEI